MRFIIEQIPYRVGRAMPAILISFSFLVGGAHTLLSSSGILPLFAYAAGCRVYYVFK
jgi:hypothetical protein